MFCEKCGTPVNEGDTFCPNCGAPVGAKPAATPALNPTPIMIWGIIALALCEAPIVGIIFAAIARKKVKGYYAAGGELCTQSKLGSIFSKIAMPLSIIMTICILIGGIASACIMIAAGVVDEALAMLLL